MSNDLVQPPLWEPDCLWEPKPTFSWSSERRVAIDLETRDPDIKKSWGPRGSGYVIGVAVATLDRSGYFPIRHAGSGNMDANCVWRWLRSEAKNFQGEIVGANLSYDLDWLWSHGVTFHERARFRDVQIAEPLLDENQFSYGLGAIAGRYGVPGKDETLLRQAARLYSIDAKKDMWKLPASLVGQYAEQDVKLPLLLIEEQHRRLRAQNLWDVYELESQILPITVKMRNRGVKINLDRLDQVDEWAYERAAEQMAEASRICGIRINADETKSKKPLAAAFDKMGYHYGMTDGKRPQPQIDEEFLLRSGSLGRAVLKARQMVTIRSYVKSIHKHRVNNRIHGSFNQLKLTPEEGSNKGTVTGRFSSTNPNVQQQPSAKFWRSIYEPDTDLWACCDFSSQEPRLAVHFADLLGLRGAETVRNEYCVNPDYDLHNWTVGIVFKRFDCNHPEYNSLRKKCKTIFLGILYGMGGGKMAAQLGLPTHLKERIDGSGTYLAPGAEAQSILDAYHSQLPWVKDLAKIAQRQAEDRGYVRTAGGRLCRFSVGDFTYKALNRIIQGSAADQIKKAMLDADAAGFNIQLQVHDELDMSVESKEHAQQLGEIMKDSLQLQVPNKVDVEVGPNWGDIS